LQGNLALVLHAHLPFVRHPENNAYLEERWLFEALTESYLPLLASLEKLAAEKVPYRLTISLSPPLMAMLADPLLQERYLSHLNRLIELAEKEVKRTQGQPEFHPLALMYLERLEQCKRSYLDEYALNPLNGFRKLQAEGYLEVITCAGTHGFLPLAGIEEETVRAQVQSALEEYYRHFQQKPAGIWLPECGYSPGHDQILADAGLRYFIVDAHGLLFATPRPRYAVYAPVRTPFGVSAFARDLETSKQVWSAKEGYPGDPDYREFYRDIGYDLDWDYIKPYVHQEKIRVDTGFKYFRITGNTEEKAPYQPDWAFQKAVLHAGNFIFNRRHQFQYLSAKMDREPIIVAPYDAELFGHWWYEGPLWLEYVLRKSVFDQKAYRLATPGDYLKRSGELQPCTPAMSSWGKGGYNEVWLNGTNDWIYPHLHASAKRMTALANNYPLTRGELREALNQAAREVLLAQSSDWAFIMETGTMTDYAVRRTKKHVNRFLALERQIESGRVESDYLQKVREEDNLFPDLDYRIFMSK